MPHSDDPGRLAVVASFLERLLTDRDRGQVATLEEYQSRYPGYEDQVASEFARVVDGVGEVTELPSAETHGERTATGRTDAQPVGGETAERYRERAEIARGGMGTVFRTWDPSLRRTVAMKVLGGSEGVTDRGSGSGVVERFLEEAEVTAQLEHPGIVPVHELGVDADGQVYFTMSLVRGQNFKEIIDLVHANRDGWTQTRALGVLQRVCEAVAFAHSKDVIHRDLKPANIMVGRFGETYVMDWGLARVDGGEPAAADPSSPADRSGSARVRSSRRDAASSDPISPLITMEGDVVGTPAYMAPEQARGEVDAVGPRSDVYSIGAMLYHLLTGKMPYVDRGSGTWQEVLEAALAGPPTPVRERARAGVPEELLAICDKAMAREPADRYPGVQALGDDVRAFLENRVVRAHATGAIAELRKWVRRNRLAATAAAVAVLSLATGLATTLWLKQQADENAVRAEAGYAGALDAVESMLTEVGGSTLKNIPGADPVRKELLTAAAALYERFVTEQGERPELQQRVADTLGRLAGIYRELGDPEATERSWKLAGNAYAAMLRDQPDSTHAVQGLGWVWKQLSLVATYASRNDEAEDLLHRAEELLDDALVRHPEDRSLLWRRAGIDSGLGYLYGSTGDEARGLDYQGRAVDSLGQLVRRPDRTVEILKSFGNNAKNYAYQLIRAGRTDDAERVAQRAVSVFEALLGESPEDRTIRYGLAMALSHRGLVHDAKNESDDHLRLVDRALELHSALARDFPLDPRYHSSRASMLHNRGMLVQRKGRVEEALDLTDEAIRSQRRALAIAPGHTVYTERLANNVSSRLFILKVLGRYREILADVGEAPELRPDDYRTWRHCGGMLFMAAELAAKDESIPEVERVRVRDDAITRGAEYVRQAFERGFRELRWFDDGALATVHEHPTFVALRAEAEALLAAEPTPKTSR